MPVTHEDIAALIRGGWSVVPLRGGQKRPYHPRWADETFGPSDFDPTDNVGVKCGSPSQHRVDVDLDCPEAVAIAAAILPRTRVQGHPQRPKSHYWYTCPNIEGMKFEAPDGTMLCEIRSDRQQTVVPPSTHPSGGAITWNDAEILTQSPEELQRIVELLATATLWARHWPNAGARHDVAGPLGGYLARCNYPAILIKETVRALARVAGDSDPDDRARYAAESAAKHERGEATTGAPTLNRIFGEDVMKRVHLWMHREKDDLLASMNALHFVAQIGSTVAVGTERPSGVMFQPTAEFQKWYMNRKVGKQPQGQWWLGHPDRRQYASVVFAPPPREAPADAYNLWRGFACEPSSDASGRKCARYIEHIHEVLCNGHRDYTDWVLDFLADIVQRPGRLIGKTLAIRGPMGTGKSVFAESFGHLFGRHFISLSQREQVTGKFNAHLSGKVVVFADEALWGGAKQDVGAFKRLITQTELAVERKGIDISQEPNCVHLIIASNEKWVAPAGDRERRLVVLDVTTLKDAEYFKQLWQEVESPEFRPALLAYLLARPVDEDRLRKGIVTAGLRDQQGFSADPVQQWWEQVLFDAAVGEHDDPWPEFVSAVELYDQFSHEMSNRGAGMSHRGTRRQFSHRLRELLPPCQWETRRTVITSPSGRTLHRPSWGVALPDVELCRKWFDTMTGVPHDWPQNQLSIPLDPALEVNDSNL